MNSWGEEGRIRFSRQVNERARKSARGGGGGHRRGIKYLRGKYLENLSPFPSLPLSLSLYAITTPTIELLSDGTCYRQHIKRTSDKRQREGEEGRFEKAGVTEAPIWPVSSNVDRDG